MPNVPALWRMDTVVYLAAGRGRCSHPCRGRRMRESRRVRRSCRNRQGCQTNAHTGFYDLGLAKGRMEGIGGTQQLHHRTRRDRSGGLAFNHRRADHELHVRTRHRIKRKARMQQPDRARQRHIRRAQGSAFRRERRAACHRRRPFLCSRSGDRNRNHAGRTVRRRSLTLARRALMRCPGSVVGARDRSLHRCHLLMIVRTTLWQKSRVLCHFRQALQPVD